ncbi:unnamed protein product [Ectocarpus sp. 6 AP-2014]
MKLFLAIAALLSLTNAAVLTVDPGQSIQAALELAQPGDTIELKDGEYREDLTTVRDGEPDKRIIITGSRDAVLRGGGKEARLFQVMHSYITLDGFTIDGLLSGNGDAETDYQDMLIYITAHRETREIEQYGTKFRSAQDGVIISNMKLGRALGECVRARYFVSNLEIFGCEIADCGIGDFVFGGMVAKNGEVIYVGTAPGQTADGKSPTDEIDHSLYIHIHHNKFTGNGNECQFKEGVEYALVEHNSCSTQKDPNSGCVDARNDRTIVRYNEIFENDGAGVRIGGHVVDDHAFGSQCEVYGNIFHGNKEGSIRVQTGENTHKMCENTCTGGCEIGGSAADGFQDIEGKCDGLMKVFWVDANKAAPLATSTKTATTAADGGEPEDAEDAKEPEFDATISTQSKESMQSDKCYPVPIKDVDASSEGGKHTVHSAVDNKSLTRWSARGGGEWLQMDFGAKVKINAIEMSFFKGDQRTQDFEVAADDKTVLEKQQSSGKTLAMERFPFPRAAEASSVKITGGGNSENEWNSLTEVIVCGVDEAKPEPEPERDEKEKEEGLCEKVEKLEIDKIQASADDGDEYKAENLMDGDLKTRWAANGLEEEELKITLEKLSTVSEIGLAVYEGDKTKAFFDVMVETEAHGWEEVIIDGESVKGKGIESYDLGLTGVKQVKVVTYGAEDIESGEAAKETSFTEVEVYGC